MDKKQLMQDLIKAAYAQAEMPPEQKTAMDGIFGIGVTSGVVVTLDAWSKDHDAQQAEIDELDSLLNQAGEVFEIMRVADEHLAKLFKGSTDPTFTPVSNLLPGIVMPTVDSLEAAINESIIDDLMGGRPIPATVTVKQVGTYGVNLSPEEIAALEAIAAERKQAQMQMRAQWLEEMMKLDSDSSEPVPPPPLPPIIGQIYECVGKGGSYECLGLAKPAGEAKDEIGEVYAYRCTETGQLYFRLPSDFNERMRLK